MPFCYHILSKIDGEDLGIVISRLNKEELKLIAKEISYIFNKFKSLPADDVFGEMSGLDEEKYNTLFEIIKNQQAIILERNLKTGIIDEESMNILEQIIEDYKDYFINAKSGLYYDDICSKNIMIYKRRFNGIVDLDFLMRGDYLEAIGRIMASWYGDKHGEVYIDEIIKQQKLNNNQKKIVKMYAVLHLIYWLSEEGIKFNSNSSGVVDWDNVKKTKKRLSAYLIV